MIDDCDDDGDLTTEVPSDISCDTEGGVNNSLSGDSEGSDLSENGKDFYDSETDKLPEAELNEKSGNEDDCYGEKFDAFCDLSEEGNDNIERICAETQGKSGDVDATPFGTKIDEYNSSVLDSNGNLRVRGNEEYFKLSPDQRDAFEEKYNSLTPEEQAEYDANCAMADLKEYKRLVESGECRADPTIERDLIDIIDGKYSRSEDADEAVAEFAARGTMTAIGTVLELDPVTKSQAAEQAAYIGRNFGPNIMTSMAETAYMQQGIHLSVPLVHENEYGEKFHDYGQTEIKAQSYSEVNDLNQLKVSYCNDLLERSEYPETIDKTIVELPWDKISVEGNGIKREEFSKCKDNLIREWENKNGCKWPTYNEDVYSPSGKLIRRAGDRYDAHHIQPLTFGGENRSSNLTPLHAAEHYDKQGIHSPESPFGKLEKYYREKQ